MHWDKQATLSALSRADDLPNFGPRPEDEWLEASSNLHELMELGEVEEVKQESGPEDDDDQRLIDEMEDFLSFHESAFQVPLASDEPTPFDECPLANSTITDEEKFLAEELIDNLFLSTIEMDQDIKIEATQLTEAISISGSDSGYASHIDISNIAEMNDIIIVIAPDSPTASEIESSIIDSQSVEPSAESDEDSVWSPASEARSASPKAKRKPYQRKRLPGIDKKERKKIQNVEAARRYRDKKKNEQQLLDEEVDELAKKNQELQGKVNEKENELKTLKKLMAELGLIKIGAKSYTLARP